METKEPHDYLTAQQREHMKNVAKMIDVFMAFGGAIVNSSHDAVLKDQARGDEKILSNTYPALEVAYGRQAIVQLCASFLENVAAVEGVAYKKRDRDAIRHHLREQFTVILKNMRESPLSEPTDDDEARAEWRYR